MATKTYKKIVHEGNLNGWKNPKESGTISFEEDHAKVLNDQFSNSGVKYEEIPGGDIEPAKEKPKKVEAFKKLDNGLVVKEGETEKVNAVPAIPKKAADPRKSRAKVPEVPKA